MAMLPCTTRSSMGKISRATLTATLVAFLLALSGCVTNPTKEDVGKVLGALGGAGVGSLFGKGDGKTAMMVVGGIVGYMVGGKAGARMDKEDQERAALLAHQSFQDPKPGTRSDAWTNPRGTRYETQVRTNPVYTDLGRKCRPYTQVTTVWIDGKPETASEPGTACFEATPEFPQGTWRIQR